MKVQISVNSKLCETICGNVMQVANVADGVTSNRASREAQNKITAVREFAQKGKTANSEAYRLNGVMMDRENDTRDYHYTIELQDGFVADLVSIVTRMVIHFWPLIAQFYALGNTMNTLVVSWTSTIKEFSAGFNARWFPNKKVGKKPKVKGHNAPNAEGNKVAKKTTEMRPKPLHTILILKDEKGYDGSYAAALLRKESAADDAPISIVKIIAPERFSERNNSKVDPDMDLIREIVDGMEEKHMFLWYADLDAATLERMARYSSIDDYLFAPNLEAMEKYQYLASKGNANYRIIGGKYKRTLVSYASGYRLLTKEKHDQQ